MKIKLDENLPTSLASILTSFGHNVDTSHDEGLAGYDDRKIWAAAQREDRFLLTQDLDFSDIRRFVPGTHCGILLIRLHSPSRLALIQRISEIFQTESVNEWKRCFVVATARKIRVKRPPATT